jgi:hypothetical protein
MPFRSVLKPVPLAPRHRRVWRLWRWWCSCGLRWKTCPDRHATVPVEPAANEQAASRERSATHEPKTQRPTTHRYAGNAAQRRYAPDRDRTVNFPRWTDLPWNADRQRWNSMTVAYPQVGRAGALTLAQQWRANGGRW